MLLPCKVQGNEDYLIALVDTGTQASLVHKKYVQKSKIEPSDTTVVAANDLEVPVIAVSYTHLTLPTIYSV